MDSLRVWTEYHIPGLLSGTVFSYIFFTHRECSMIYLLSKLLGILKNQLADFYAAPG